MGSSPEVRFPARTKTLFFSTSARQALGPTQPPMEWVSGAFSSRVKRLGREAHHSPPPSAEVRNTAAILPVGRSKQHWTYPVRGYEILYVNSSKKIM